MNATKSTTRIQMTSEKRVQRTGRAGVPVANFRRVVKASDDTEATAQTDQVDQADPPAVYGDSPRAKRRWERLREYFASPLKAKALQTKVERHTSSLRERAFDKTPIDYRSMLAKHRGRGDE
jgi:hypothetical protein